MLLPTLQHLRPLSLCRPGLARLSHFANPVCRYTRRCLLTSLISASRTRAQGWRDRCRSQVSRRTTWRHSYGSSRRYSYGSTRWYSTLITQKLPLRAACNASFTGRVTSPNLLPTNQTEPQPGAGPAGPAVPDAPTAAATAPFLRSPSLVGCHGADEIRCRRGEAVSGTGSPASNSPQPRTASACRELD